MGARSLKEAGFEDGWQHMCADMAATRPAAPDLFRCIEAMKAVRAVAWSSPDDLWFLQGQQHTIELQI
jgi:hypothetical protein